MNTTTRCLEIDTMRIALREKYTAEHSPRRYASLVAIGHPVGCRRQQE